ncbi:MAG: hypothetical protein DCO81_07720 [Candidatus Aquiluna sp. XM-24bin5]|nr:MAG: hypothetical protein DCO81_07720 [Candidatus Aquiluna sp. XM-24bin5]
MTKIYSIVLTETKTTTDKQRFTVCRNIARNYPATAYRHSHQSNRKGGFENPHIHLVIALPDNKVSLWLDGILEDLTARDKYNLFSTSLRAKWQEIRDLRAYLHYISGNAREHIPELVFQTSDWNRFVHEHLSRAPKQ